jgi:hypothetical protein
MTSAIAKAASKKLTKGITSLLNLKSSNVPDVPTERGARNLMLGKLGKKKLGLLKSIKKLREDLKAGKYKGDDKANMQRRLKRDVETLSKISTSIFNIREMNKGGTLKSIPTGNKGKGLSMLPTSVRNNMGFMKKGGFMKKAFGSTNFKMNKGGLLMITIDHIKKKMKK